MSNDELVSLVKATNSSENMIGSKSFSADIEAKESSQYHSVSGDSTQRNAYLSTSLPRELMFCIFICAFGCYSPSLIFLPFFGGINMRPIPYQVLSTKDVILDMELNHELKENVTIPSGILISTCVTLPIIILALISLKWPICHPKYFDLHSSFCLPLVAIGMSEFITQIFKFYVGRLRPNFYALCGFDTTTLRCTADEDNILESHLSFPSGHTSMSFCGMGVLVWILLGRAESASRNSAGTSKLLFSYRKLNFVFAFLPWLYAGFVGTSRIVDNWHHPSDVIAGGLIGIFSSTISYHLWYPPIFSKTAGIPISICREKKKDLPVSK